MGEDRSRVLKMLAEGKISVEEAQSLLETLKEGGGEADAADGGQGATSTTAVAAAAPAKVKKYLRVVVEGPNENVDVRVPLALIRAGIKLGGLLPHGAAITVKESLKQSGIDLDALNSRNPESVEELVAGIAEMTVDVESAGQKVRVFCE